MGDENYEPDAYAAPKSELGKGDMELEPDPEARQWAMFAHLAALAGYTGIPFANIWGPLIVWLPRGVASSLSRPKFPEIGNAIMLVSCN